MSKLSELLNQKSAPATSATPATPAPESSKRSNCSKGRYQKARSGNDRLRLFAGDDWPEISADPEQLAALKAAAETAEQIQRGEVPAHYTAQTECRHCGPVPIFPGLPAKIDGCPWCFNRVAGRSVPSARHEGNGDD